MFVTRFSFSTRSFRKPTSGFDDFPINPFGSGPTCVNVTVIGVGWKPDVNKNRKTGLKSTDCVLF